MVTNFKLKDGLIDLRKLHEDDFANIIKSMPDDFAVPHPSADIEITKANADVYATVSPLNFTRNGKPIEFHGLNNEEVDPESGVYIHRSVARLDKGIPNPKVRPVLPLPWSLEFNLFIYPNKEIQEQEILNLIEEGGRALGVGTYRGVYGKFYVETWE